MLVKNELTYLQSLGLLLSVLFVFFTALYSVRHALLLRYEAYYWSRALSTPAFYISDFKMLSAVAALGVSLGWLSLLKVFIQKQFNAPAFAVTTCLLLPLPQLHRYLSLVFPTSHLTFNFSLLAVEFVALVVMFLGIGKLLQRCTEFLPAVKFYRIFTLICTASLVAFLVFTQVSTLATLSDEQRHNRALNYFGDTYLTVYTVLPECSSFKDYAGELKTFFPALASLSDTLHFRENNSAKYAFIFEGEKRSGTVEADIYLRNKDDIAAKSQLYVLGEQSAIVLECNFLWLQFR